MWNVISLCNFCLNVCLLLQLTLLFILADFKTSVRQNTFQPVFDIRASEGWVFLPDSFHSISSEMSRFCSARTSSAVDAPSSVLSCFWRFRGTLPRARGCWREMGCPRWRKTCWTSPRGGTFTQVTCCPLWRSFATWQRPSREPVMNHRQMMCK